MKHVRIRSVACTLGAFAAGAWAASPTPAEACLPNPHCAEVFFPRDGASGIPTNTALWSLYEGALELSTEGASPLALSFDGSARFTALPEVLAPNTLYSLNVTTTGNLPGSSGCPDQTITFTTGDGPDQRPTPPVIDEVDTTFFENENGCSSAIEARYYVDISFEGPFDPNTIGYRLYITTDPSNPALRAESLDQSGVAIAGVGTSVQDDFAVVAISASGLESEPAQFSIDKSADDRTGAGCSIAPATFPGGASIVAMLVILAALAPRRRQHTRQA
ncbi:MAG: hypothetical protein IPL79_12415 [Myxococcales bacterium]|nr:hypothetical protein [Myxococcales bacterium]